MSTREYLIETRALIQAILSELPSPAPLLQALNIEDVSLLQQWLVEDGALDHLALQQRLHLFCASESLDQLFAKTGVNPIDPFPTLDIYRPFRFSDPPLRSPKPWRLPIYLRNRRTKIGGHEVNFPIGVPASVLTSTAGWIREYAGQGWNVLTYKTVRTFAQSPHAHPTWVFVPKAHQLTAATVDRPLEGDIDSWPDTPDQVTMANSFGIPSLAPGEWQADIEQARKALHDGQVIIVSVVGSTPPGTFATFEDIKDDFVRAAQMAHDAGADLVELNFSCPNLEGSPVGDLYCMPDEARSIAKAVAEAIGEEPFIKIGYLPHKQLEALLLATADHIRGVSAINTVSVPIVSERDSHRSAFPGRPTAGVSGSAIKKLAMSTIENISVLREKHHLHLDSIATGGVTSSKDFEDFMALGATAVQSCTGAFINPQLAIDIRKASELLQGSPFVTTINPIRKEVEEVSAERPVPVQPNVQVQAKTKERRPPKLTREGINGMELFPSIRRLLESIIDQEEKQEGKQTAVQR